MQACSGWSPQMPGVGFGSGEKDHISILHFSSACQPRCFKRHFQLYYTNKHHGSGTQQHPEVLALVEPEQKMEDEKAFTGHARQDGMDSSLLLSSFSTTWTLEITHGTSIEGLWGGRGGRLSRDLRTGGRTQQSGTKHKRRHSVALGKRKSLNQ